MDLVNLIPGNFEMIRLVKVTGRSQLRLPRKSSLVRNLLTLYRKKKPGMEVINMEVGRMISNTLMFPSSRRETARKMINILKASMMNVVVRWLNPSTPLKCIRTGF